MGRPVQCYVYDMSGGMTKALSRLAGLEIEGAWHSSIVVGGVEHFYGYGLQKATPGTTPFGKPLKVLDLGEIEMPDAMVQDLLEELRPRYKAEDYSFLWHNCNHFCNELSVLLTGNPVPEYLTTQGNVVQENPLLASMMPLFQQMEFVTGSATAEGFVDAEGNLMKGATPGQMFMNAAMSRLNTASSKQMQAAMAGLDASADLEAKAPGAITGATGAGGAHVGDDAVAGNAQLSSYGASSSDTPSSSSAMQPTAGPSGAGASTSQVPAGAEAMAQSAKSAASGPSDGLCADGAAASAVKGGVPTLPKRKGPGAV